VEDQSMELQTGNEVNTDINNLNPSKVYKNPWKLILQHELRKNDSNMQE